MSELERIENVVIEYNQLILEEEQLVFTLMLRFSRKKQRELAIQCKHAGCRPIVELLQALDCHSWEQLKGKSVSVKIDSSDRIIAIGNRYRFAWLNESRYFKFGSKYSS
jgi:hypothetical protein